MKKRWIILVCALAAAAALAGCGRHVFTLDAADPKTIVITAENAKNDAATIGTLTVDEGEEVRIDSDFKSGGSLRIALSQAPDAGIDADPSEFLQSEALMEAEISDTGSGTFTLEPGNYMISVEVQGKLSGTATISALIPEA